MKKLGRPLKTESIIEELLMEIQATAMTGAEDGTLTTKVRDMFKRIVETASTTQAVRMGLRTEDHRFNGHLLQLLGWEALN